MVISTFSSNKIKIIFDIKDLEKINISIEEWNSNPQKTIYFIEKILNNFNKKILFSKNKININDFYIYTYNFKIFKLELYLT